MSGLVFGIENLPQHNGYVVTQGNFDGVHKGHMHVLQQVVRIAQQENLPSILITFHPHPRLIVNPNDKSLSLLSSIKEKAQRILDLGIDTVLVLPFTEEIASLSPQDFITGILVEKLKVKHMVVGYDHRFGKNRSGGFHELVQWAPNYGFQVSEISPKEIDEIAVSSTRIRKALLAGNLQEANELLGYNYMLSGTVIHGQKRGRTIGFPTANLQIDEPGKLIPPHGVYAGFAVLGDGKAERIPMVLNIGVRPTIDGTHLTIEAHLLDFTADLYDQSIQLELIEFIRPEQKFNSFDDLKNQIQKDALTARDITSQFQLNNPL